MEFINIPTEQTTAFTDAVLATVAVVSALYLLWISKDNRWKTILWVCIFSLLGLTSGLGVIVHGLKISSILQTTLWNILYISLGLLVAFFIVAVVYDIWGESAAKRILPIMMCIGFVFWGFTLIWPDSFLVFTVYEAIGMIFALGGYFWLACRNNFKGAWVMFAGILITIFAAVIQADEAISITYIWSFDHNGVYHLVQMVGILLLVSGLRSSLLSFRNKESDKI
jgi:hypothetical protein